MFRSRGLPGCRTHHLRGGLLLRADTAVPEGRDCFTTGDDRDLMEVTVLQLEQFYAAHKYTVTEVVRWYMARADKYNGIYRAVQNLDAPGALATAAQEDADARKGGAGFVRGPLWGVPIVIKANTSIKGLITTDGWKGYTIPGHEFVAPKDATVVARLRAAGAVIMVTPICRTLPPATPTGARLTGVPAMPTMCASARVVRRVAPLRRSRRTTRCWAMEPTRATRSGCPQLPALMRRCLRMAGSAEVRTARRDGST